VCFNPATKSIYNVTWTRLNDTTLNITCEVACRSPNISGCHIHLLENNDSGKRITGISTTVIGMSDKFNSHYVNILVNDVNPTVDYNFTANSIATVGRTFITLDSITGNIPATIQDIYVIDINHIHLVSM